VLATVSFYALLAELVDLLVALTVDGRWHLQELLPLESRGKKMRERDKLSFDFITTPIFLQYFLNRSLLTSHI
jgi:hypothetical protein